MEPESFVKQLSGLAPTCEELLSQGLSEVSARAYLRRYNPVPRNRKLVWPDPVRSPLIRLLCEWHVEEVEIGMVSFLSGPIQCDTKIQVGRSRLIRCSMLCE